MKAHKPPDTFSQIKREVAAELNRQEPELFKKHAEQLIPQLYAMVLYTLATCEGYGEKRLKRFCEHIHDIDELIRISAHTRDFSRELAETIVSV